MISYYVCDVQTENTLKNYILHHLRIKKEMLRVPIFQIISADRPTGKIYRASSFSNRIVDLEYRARYEENIEIYNIRREALVKVNKKLLRTKYLYRDTNC